jgi:hypothetical protein
MAAHPKTIAGARISGASAKQCGGDILAPGMTLVLNVLTHHEVVQVSDRRFSYIAADGTVTRQDDEKNKSVLFCGRLVFSFTGLGEIGPDRRTDLWLAKGLAAWVAEVERVGTGPKDQRDLLNDLTERATTQFRKPRYRGQPHAFVAVGWARFSPESDDYRPYLACISNFHNANGSELDAVSSTFNFWAHVLQEDRGGFLWTAGQRLESDEQDALVSELSEADRQRAPELLIQAMGDTVRALAERNKFVGKGLMINVLPKASLSGSGLIAAGPPLHHDQTFLYVPPEGVSAVQLGPVATCGGTVISDFRSAPLDHVPEPSSTRSRREASMAVRRFYVAPIVGTGTQDDPYRANVHGHNHSAVIPSDERGHPLHSVALVLVSAEDHAQLEGDPAILAVADVTELDTLVENLPPDRRAQLATVSARYAVAPEGLVREVVRRLGQTLQPDFHEDDLWTQ